ncbi:MAG: rhamnogalacturonan lyase [Oscillospiraceae bacterium]|nr:rhamnogalacturonan lyase [Oscillospiraceae bacterium]
MLKRITALAAAAAMAITAIPITGAVTAFADDIAVPQPVQMEYLDRGTVAVKIDNGVYLSWRLLGTEEYDTAFDVYRDGVKITTVTDSTNYTDSDGTINSKYTVVPSGAELTNSITIDDSRRNITAVTNTSGLTAIAASYDSDNRLENVHIENLMFGKNEFTTDFDVDKAFLWDNMRPMEGRSGVSAEDIQADAVSVWADNSLTIPLDKPAAVKLADGKTYQYSANDASVGDLDGDGDYEIILKWDCNGKDNSQSGYTGNVLIDAYDLEGNKLWRIDLGPNIRAGAHYTQFIVYDFDLDGKAEIAMKTAPGSKDSYGTYVNTVSLDPAVRSGDNSISYVDEGGFITEGPEYYSVFNGEGMVIDTVMYPFLRTDSNRNWGLDSGGRPETTNRVDRFLGTTAYLDGVHPSIITWRGYYAKTTVAAYTLENGRLIKGNTFNAETGAQFSGQGNHNITVGDVDGDGKDEIICGALALDDDLSVLWSSGRGHGDALHMSDYDPTHVGLEYFSVHESGGYSISGSTNGNDGKPADYGMTVYDAADGTELGHWSASDDTGRGMMADIGAGGYYQLTGGGNYRANGGTSFSSGNYGMSQNFRIFWDGDTYDELLDGTNITNYTGGRNMSTIFTASGCTAINGTKNNPAIQADILGDWREEVVYPTSNSTALKLYTTTIETNHKLYTLMHDRAYRMQVTNEQTAYNQPPHIGYYISENKDMYDAREYAAYVKTVHNGVTKQRITNTEGKDTTVDITINFLDMDGNTVRDSVTEQAAIGTTYSVPSKYLEDFGYDANTKMCYRYVSGGDGLKIGNDPTASITIDLVFRYTKAEIDYAVNAVDKDGNAVMTLYTGIYRPDTGTITRYGDYGIVDNNGNYYVLADKSENSVTFEPTEDEPNASIVYEKVDGNGAKVDFEFANVSMLESNKYISVKSIDYRNSIINKAINGNGAAKLSVAVNGAYPKEGSTEDFGIASWDLSQYVGDHKKVTVSYDTYFDYSNSGRMAISLLDKDPESCWDGGWYRIQHHRPGGGKAQGFWFDGSNENMDAYLNHWIRGSFTLDLETGEASWLFINRETNERIPLKTNGRTTDLRSLKSLTLMTWLPNDFTVYLDNLSVVAYD